MHTHREDEPNSRNDVDEDILRRQVDREHTRQTSLKYAMQEKTRLPCEECTADDECDETGARPVAREADDWNHSEIGKWESNGHRRASESRHVRGGRGGWWKRDFRRIA